MYLEGAVWYNPQTKPASKKRSFIFDPIFNKVQKLRCCTKITGAVYRGPVHNMCGGSLAAKFSILNVGRLEVTVAPLSYGCCKGLLNRTVNPVGIGLWQQNKITELADCKTEVAHSKNKVLRF